MIRKLLRPMAAAVLMATMCLVQMPVFTSGQTAFAAESTAPPQTGDKPVELNFDDNTADGFQIYTDGGSCTIAAPEGQLDVDITNVGSKNYACQVYWDGFSLVENCTYVYSFDVTSEINRTMEYRLQLNGGDYHAYAGNTVEIGTETKHIEQEFTMAEATDPAPRLCFNLGQGEGMDTNTAEHHVKIDNICLEVKDASKVVTAEETAEASTVAVDQVGYRPDDRKYVYVKTEAAGGTWQVIGEDSAEPVLEGDLSEPTWDAAAGTQVTTGDFTELREPGTYHIHVTTAEGETDSPEFTIGEDVYKDLFASVSRMLYLQRCGVETEEAIAGEFAHGVCHDSEALIYGTDETKDVSGGWHDAGDYGRYVVSGGKTVADLFLAVENFGADQDDLGIPESGNGVPDLLDEARFELDWMLKMQDPETGGVYHKVTCRSFPGEVRPEEETDQLVLSPISTAATGDFAAVMARASVIYREIDAEFAEQALAAAQKAWDYIKDLNDTTGFVNPEEIVTGEYPDRGTKDEQFWAAAELYLAGGPAEEEYAAFMKANYNDYLRLGLGWARITSYAFYDLIGGSELVTMDEDMQGMVENMKERLIQEADELKAAAEKDGYGVTLGKDYQWGSNMTVGNNAMALLLAAQITGNSEYADTALGQIHYLLGANAPGYCYVSGFGTLSPQNPHHRPSQAVGKAMPGMLAGGPDMNLEDPYARAVLSGNAPAMCYADNSQTYSTNEVTVYWNSPLICALAALIN